MSSCRSRGGVAYARHLRLGSQGLESGDFKRVKGTGIPLEPDGLLWFQRVSERVKGRDTDRARNGGGS